MLPNGHRSKASGFRTEAEPATPGTRGDSKVCILKAQIVSGLIGFVCVRALFGFSGSCSSGLEIDYLKSRADARMHTVKMRFLIGSTFGKLQGIQRERERDRERRIATSVACFKQKVSSAALGELAAFKAETRRMNLDFDHKLFSQGI